MTKDLNNDIKKSKPSKSKANNGYLITNHLNMLYMLAAGMVMGPAGFRGKHYIDPLSDYPGWAPLFWKEKIPNSALEYAISERSHLKLCIASFDLNTISGKVEALPSDGETKNVNLPRKRKGRNEIGILIPTPLPLSLLSSIHFSSEEDMQVFKSTAEDVSNVDLSFYKIEVMQSLFLVKNKEKIWPPLQKSNNNEDKPPAFGLALGGVLAMLYQITNHNDLGDLGLNLLGLVTRTNHNPDFELTDPILQQLPNWIDGLDIQGDTPVQLFWGSIKTLIKNQEEESQNPSIEVVLGYLENELLNLKQDTYGPRLEKLIEDMKDCYGLGSNTISELFERHKGSLSRSLLLLCLRENCSKLLEFSHPLLTEADYIITAILFGVRDTWLRIPKELRHPDISFFVMNAMAKAEQSKHEIKIDFTTQSHHFPPLSEFLSSLDGDLSNIQPSKALELARLCNWNNCIQTRIILPDDDYPENFKRNGNLLILPREVIAESEIIPEKFLLHLKRWKWIPTEIETELYEILSKGNR